MCGIFLTTDKNNIKILANGNKHRGNKRWSLCVIENNKIIQQINTPKPYNDSDLHLQLICEGDMYIGHIQAPTTIDSDFHPATAINSYLWHNGIIKNNYVKILQKEYDSCWDTKLMCILLENDTIKLDDIDGSFSCIKLIKKVGIFIFRNEISPLFTNETQSDFSSVKTQITNIVVLPNIMYSYNKYKLIKEGIFKTKNNPYYI